MVTFLRGFITKVYLEYTKELHKLHNNYPWGSDKLELKR